MMQQHMAHPNRPSASAAALTSPVRTMQQPAYASVSSAASPVCIAMPTGRPYDMLATSKVNFNTPVISPCNVIASQKTAGIGVFTPTLRGVSPTSVASPIAPQRMGGIPLGPRLPGGIIGTRLNYGHRSPGSELVFEPVDREPRRRLHNMSCSPRAIMNVDDTNTDTATDISSTATASIPASPHSSASFLKLRSGSLGSINDASHEHRSRASSVSTTRSTASASPTPQNLKDNPERLAKVKTEMCRYYELGGLKNCPWGDKCNYAHGKHELKFNYSSLTLMEKSGQIVNAKTYLSRPCMTWTSTGACPFGRRCPAIHDPSITGPKENPSWLPAASAKTNAQIIVDRFAAHRDSTVHQEHPLVAQGIWENCRPSLRLRGSKQQATIKVGDDGCEDDMIWMDTYALICNVDVPAFGAWTLSDASKSKRGAPIPSMHSSSKKPSELQKLCIVSLMRGQESACNNGESKQSHLLHRDYVFAPTHSLHSELCMILQTRYFLLLDMDGGHQSQGYSAAAAAGGGGGADKHTVVKEISFDEYKSRTTPWSSDYRFNKSKVVVANEVAFAPKGDSSANVSIWFDAKPIKLEPSQIKRCRRLKQKKKAQMRNGHIAPHANGALVCRTSAADFPSQAPPGIVPFVPMLPAEDRVENEKFMLAIIDHRIDCLINEIFSHGGLRDDRQQRDLDRRMQTLRAEFAALNHFHKKWIWPKREGSEVVNESTLAPPSNIMPYIPSRSSKGSTCSSMWHSFVSAVTSDATKSSTISMRSSNITGNESGQLSTFQALANGAPVPTLSRGVRSRRIPYIKPSSHETDNDKENTWREIVLGADGKWKNACRLYNESRVKVVSPSMIDSRNMPLSTIPFVQPQS